MHLRYKRNSTQNKNYDDIMHRNVYLPCGLTEQYTSLPGTFYFDMSFYVYTDSEFINIIRLRDGSCCIINILE